MRAIENIPVLGADLAYRVFHEAQQCVRCSELAATRRTVVFGSGNADADLMFVGEAPGRDEDEQGLAFVGKAGQLLTRIIEALGKKRGEKHRRTANTAQEERHQEQPENTAVED